MEIRTHALRMELVSTMRKIDDQMNEVNRLAKKLGTEPHIIRDSQGGYVLAPLLAAKAQCLHALALLQTKE